MDTMTVGNRLVELCRAGKNREAIEALYADEVEVSEAMAVADPENYDLSPVGTQTRAEVLASNDRFFSIHEVNAVAVEGPYPHGDAFIVRMRFETTRKAGPMTGQPMVLEEAVRYGVRDGKIVSSFFYYPPM